MRCARLAILAAFCFLLSACNQANDPAGPQAGKGGASPVAGDLEIGEPVHVENMTVFAVTSKTPRNDDRFITLDEGLKAGTIEILEVGAADENVGQAASLPDNAENAEATTASNPTESSTGDLIRDSDFEGLTPAPTPPATDFDEPAADVEIPPDNSAANQQTEGQVVELNQTEPDYTAWGIGRALSGNDVNKLVVINRSDRPLYLMPGEVIVGGSQDRTIGQELVIAPDGKPTPIDVFCVERGRWGGREGSETMTLLSTAAQNEANAGTVVLSDGAAPSDAAQQAAQGKFVASVGSVNADTRRVVQQTAKQDDVWNEVAKNNAKSGVQVASGAFTHNYVDAEAVKRLDPFIEKLQAKIAETDRIVGVIVAIDGQVESIDVFESTPLFRKLWPKLLKSYALDAVTAAGETGEAADGANKKAASKTCTWADAVAFFNEASQADVNNRETKSGVLLVHRDSDRVVTFSAADPSVANPSAADNANTGGFGGAIHASAFAK